jgi:hypothetical protein
MTANQSRQEDIDMQPVRLIFEDTPAFVQIPEALQHERTEVIVWPLAPDEKAVTTPASRTVLPSLAEFRAALPHQDTTSGSFCQNMRDEDRY